METPQPPDSWPIPQKILVLLAHPDDPEFFCGATLARWARLGHEIHYILLTCGDKGGDLNTTPSDLCTSRQTEQENAARVLGVRSVRFLNLEDGYLVPSLELRREMVRIIRREKPDILVTCDPTNLYPSSGYGLNHPDHRAAGQVVLDAVFPAAGNPHFFPELLHEGFEPHTPREVWVSLTAQPNVTLDVTDTWEIKLQALKEHKSQIGDPAEFEKRMRARHTEDSTEEAPRYEERFHVIKFHA
ncbi:MAG: PIG-L family deacetylase [Anaerolineales bacterium]|nr:PIG-L family deacetylase [Anaerolineales bacterium]MCX7608712.1 PIG-L family deacetylase [Anaerolineales bacterium]MDW8228085.1 PIG-L deacetylase family protein [Anaerolineales bacterium]